MSNAMADVLAERKRQDAKWGEQNHPLQCQPRPRMACLAGPAACSAHNIASASSARDACEEAASRGGLTWADILVEEVAEAIEAAAIHGDTSDDARAEVVQVAAVALAMIECIDRKRARETGDE